MANTSVSGLVSGLDTATIINQLMQLEAQPQTRLKSRVTTQQSAVTALQALNTKLSTLATKAGELAKSAGWGASTASTDHDEVTATASSGATPATLSFTVGQTASRSQALFATAATTSDPVAPASSSLTFTYADGRTATIDTGDGSLAAVAAAVSAATVDGTSDDAGLDAVLVRAGGTDAAPTYRLMVTTAVTGDATRFTVSDPSFLGGATVTDGRDATITVDGQESRSATNTFRGLMPGVDVTLKPGAASGAAVTLTVARDAAALTDKVKGIVDALNTALTDISTLTASGANGAKAGALAGNATLRQVRDQLISSVTNGVGGQTLAEVGIQVDRYGKVTFDAEKFSTAYATDPAQVEALFVDTDPDAASGSNTDFGFATAVEQLGKRLSSSTDGVVTSLVKGRQSAIDGLNDAIESWDSRLAVKRSALERQYGALEVALGKLQSQSSWLAGQINSLPQIQSGS